MALLLVVPLFLAQEEAETPDLSAIVGPGTEDDFILQGGFDTKPSRTMKFEDFERQVQGEDDRFALAPAMTTRRLTRQCRRHIQDLPRDYPAAWIGKQEANLVTVIRSTAPGSTH